MLIETKLMKKMRLVLAFSKTTVTSSSMEIMVITIPSKVMHTLVNGAEVYVIFGTETKQTKLTSL